MIKTFLAIGLLTSSTLLADSIHTYGGGQLLERVFQALSSILYGNSKEGLEQTFQALLRLSLIVGAFSALLLAFFRQRFEPLIRSFLLPGLILVGFLLVPRTSVEIEDHVTDKKSASIQTPFFLGKLASWSSYSFHEIGILFKKAIGTTYPWTSNISESKNFFRPGPLPQEIEENFREYCRECVLWDLSLSRYSKQELGSAPNLFDFLTRRSATQRAVLFDGELISCQEAIASLRQRCESFHLDTEPPQIDGSQKNLTQQKLAIEILEEEIFRPNLKSPPPESFGAQGVVVIKNLQGFFEASLYLIFPLIVLLSFLSFGMKTALFWLRCIIWVSTWPIFFLSVDLFLDAVWAVRSGSLTFNLENGARLAELYASMETIACAALATIPFLSWFLIKGGISQLASIFSLSPPETRETKIEIEQPASHQRPESDAARQTHWEALARDAPDESSFKATVESSRLEERVDALQSSLSSIQEAVKDSSREISRAVKDSSRPFQSARPDPAPPISSTPAAEEEGGQGGSRMHIPSHGSWSEPQS